jgi:hypothetical protein
MKLIKYKLIKIQNIYRNINLTCYPKHRKIDNLTDVNCSTETAISLGNHKISMAVCV